jgi:hypothetical protein
MRIILSLASISRQLSKAAARLNQILLRREEKQEVAACPAASGHANFPGRVCERGKRRPFREKAMASTQAIGETDVGDGGGSHARPVPSDVTTLDEAA